MTVTPQSTEREIRVRLAAGVVAFAAGIGAVVTIVLLAQSVLGTASSGSTRSTLGSTSTAGSNADRETMFPEPPNGALVLARQDRDLAVGLAASPVPGGAAFQAAVIGQDGPAAGLDVAFQVVSSRAQASGPAASCGVGCYETTIALDGQPKRVVVAIRSRERPPSSVSFRLPAVWPAPAAADSVHRAEQTWRALRSLVVYDHLASGPGYAVTTRWRLVAPDREAYTIDGGPEAVVIGSKRWDRNPGGRWVESVQDPIRQPVPFWIGVANAHLLGTETMRGQSVLHLSFFDPQIDAWFELWVEKETGRTLELRMTAQAHFMHQVYGQFDGPVRIVPPRSNA